MHNGFLQVEGEKMSKSLGNFVTIHDLLATQTFGGRAWPGEVLRLAMLRTHYRQPIDWTVRALEEAEQTLDRWYASRSDRQIEACDDAPSEAVLDRLVRRSEHAGGRSAALHWCFAAPSAGPCGLGRRGTPARPAAAHARRLGGTRSAGCGIDRGRVEALDRPRLAAAGAKTGPNPTGSATNSPRMGVALKDNKDGTTSWSVAPAGCVLMARSAAWPPCAPCCPPTGLMLAAIFRASIEELTQRRL